MWVEPEIRLHPGYNLPYNPFEEPWSVHLDLVLACLLICIGAMIAYIADEEWLVTPRLAAWLERVMGAG
jgi:hypothetical protein